MINKYLMEMAAVAIGIEGDVYIDSTGEYFVERVEGSDGRGYTNLHCWLSSDGDAFNLMSELRLEIKHEPVIVEVCSGDICASEFVLNEGLRVEATRKAIVRCAARLGEELVWAERMK